MKFEIGCYRVEIREGKSRVKMDVSFSHHPGLQYVYIDAPSDLIHPVFRKFFELKVKDVIDGVERREKIASVSNYIPSRLRNVSWSVRKFKQDFTNMHGDIDEAKDNWDYNRSPTGAVAAGKHGDLKGFLEFRTGRKLNLAGD